MDTTQLLRAAGATAANAARWAPAMGAAMTRYGVDTPLRIAAFLAQCAHESQRFARAEENLRYRAATLRRVWPRRFPGALADDYALQPERIANRAYADRMGNGPEHSGDGWLHRGRGPGQLTGARNYRSYAEHSGLDCVSDPDMLAQAGHGADAAGWFWASGRFSDLADAGDIYAVSRRWNGGANGLIERHSIYRAVLGVLAGRDPLDGVDRDAAPAPADPETADEEAAAALARERQLELQEIIIGGLRMSAVLGSWRRTA